MDERSRHDEAAPTPSRRERELARLAFAFMLDQAAMGLDGLPSLDAILVLAINQANVAPLTHEPLTRIRHGRLDAPAPDARRRPVSINALANSLRMPFETVRRRVKRLEGAGACAVVDGGIIVPESYLASSGYVDGVMRSHRRLTGFFHAANSAGLVEPLPRSAYPPEPAVPVRAAARIMADYILRTADALLSVVGDLTSVMVLLAIISAESGRTSVAEIALRLGMADETVRRHVKTLIAQGHVMRISTGLVTPYELMDDPAWRAFLRENAANVQRLFAGLAERGVIEAWGRLIPAASAGEASSARSAPQSG